MVLICICLEKPSMDYSESFQKKVYGLKGFKNFLSHFFIEILVLACIRYCFLDHKTYCDLLWITYEWETS